MDLSATPVLMLQAWLLSAQTAYQKLMTGDQVTSASYSQGDGSKSVTRTPASMGTLLAWIAKLEGELRNRGALVTARPVRRAIGVRF